VSKPRPNYADASIAIAAGLAITLTLTFLIVMPLVRSMAGEHDFVVYWATGQQLVHQADPYDPMAMAKIEHAAGLPIHGSFYMRNPPWGLSLALPLGHFSARAAAVPWSLLMLGVMLVSLHILWQVIGRPRNPLPLLGYAFPPALFCVMMGQTSLFLLLGLVLFLRFHRTRPLVAGAALWLCSLKPHLFLPFATALLLWIVFTRAWRILLGFVPVMAASCVVTQCVDPAAWSQYLHWAGNSGISHEPIPCLSVVFRTFINPDATWLVSIPSVIACVWAVIYFWQRRHVWDWVEHGNLLMLVSLVVAPYCWVHDQVLALPALLWAAWRTQSRPLLAMLALAYIALEVQSLNPAGLVSWSYLWPAPLWLLWYLIARSSAPSLECFPAPASAESESFATL